MPKADFWGNPEETTSAAADLIIDGIEDAIGVTPRRTREKTKTALIHILNYFFVPRTEPGPVALSASTEHGSAN